MVHGCGACLPDENVELPAATGAVCPEVEKRVAHRGVALREYAQITLARSVYLGPHGNCKRRVLVYGQVVSRIMDADQQRLPGVLKVKGVAAHAGNNIAGHEIARLHVVAADHVRRFIRLQFVQRPVCHETVGEGLRQTRLEVGRDAPHCSEQEELG